MTGFQQLKQFIQFSKQSCKKHLKQGNKKLNTNGQGYIKNLNWFLYMVSPGYLELIFTKWKQFKCQLPLLNSECNSDMQKFLEDVCDQDIIQQ
ncbi:unnamed protein product (macronuclear) [Paramecium tetraurelia]|uniref:Uncharacterized protein n=1 Tax=Paramecium tetraurelia TaxID=5888 RepID=A0DE65_PARTE|nr:uncharacterized protein GSPATT00016174001 [Paramecium tetraurelia]CAK81332.1 unnamed protein product [Paramecium tetraurelia]|eukprot:XP_001448729.1 hypothetical protein (macronuclear) [Paramecium tetraurelia strain d4-2]